MLIDTHCHIYQEYYEDIDKVIAEAKKNNVNILINIGCDNKSNEEILKLAQEHKNIYAVIGIHPENSRGYSAKDISLVEKKLNDKKVLAIGEIGLDYHYSKENIDEQKKLFINQLEIAQKQNIPVVIHSREASLDTINILKEYSLKGIIHSFSGSLESALEYIKLGYLIGINGVVTFKNCKLKDFLREIGLKNIVLETDSPYLSPEPYRGQKNTPANISIINIYIANILGLSEQDVAQQTTQNVLDLFDIK